MTQNDTTQRIDRRTVLRALGATAGLAGLGTATADEEQPTHEICIHAPSDRPSGYPYQFAVSGDIQKAETADHAPYRDAVVTADAEDDVSSGGCRVHGWAVGGVDCYKFTGDIVAFEVPEQWAHKFTIHTNGHKRNPAALRTQQQPSNVDCGGGDEEDAAAPDPDAQTQDEGYCELENTLRVTPHKTKSEPFTVEVTVTQQLELPDGQRVQKARLTVEGTGIAGDVSVDYSGRITKLSTEGPGYVSVTQNNACKGGGE